MKPENYSQSFETLAIHSGEKVGNFGAHVNPIYQTTTFLFDTLEQATKVASKEKPGYLYTRSGNPNRNALAQKLAALEGMQISQAARLSGKEPPAVKAEIFASGMGAISATILGCLKAGDHIVAHDTLYGNADHLISEVLPRYGITQSRVSCKDLDALQKELEKHPNTRMVYLETPDNPLLNLVDIAAVCELAHRAGARVVVDNTFATPVLQQPLALGADVVVHSTTKYLGGHGVAIGGAVCSAEPGLIENSIAPMVRFLGAAPSPFDCWLIALGMKTLPLRVKEHCNNAHRVAVYLSAHPSVSKVYYPGLPEFPQRELAKRQMSGFGGMVSFELKGGLAAASRLLEKVKLCGFGVSLGNVDSLIEHPASMTHRLIPAEIREKTGITDGLIRLSVGLEGVEDIIADLDAGL